MMIDKVNQQKLMNKFNIWTNHFLHSLQLYCSIWLAYSYVRPMQERWNHLLHWSH